MNQRGPSLDDLVRAHRDGVRLTDEQRSTNRAKILSRIAATGIAASTTTAGAVGAAIGGGTTSHLASGLVAKVVMGLVIASGAGAAYYAARPARSIENAASSHQEDTLPSNRAPANLPADPPVLVTEPSLEPASPAEVAENGGGASNRHAAKASPANASALAGEVQLMHDVEAALEAGQPERALQLLDARRGGRMTGPMQEERAAARIVTLCKLGRVDEARSDAARFVRDWPRSPLVERVRSSCAKTPERAPSSQK
jgi:hypothetical protein